MQTAKYVIYSEDFEVSTCFAKRMFDDKERPFDIEG